MTYRRTWLLVVVLIALIAAIIAVQYSDESHEAAPEESPARVVLPGRPGESARVTDADQVRAPDGSTYNTLDTAFVQMMIAHHAHWCTLVPLELMLVRVHR